MNILFVCRGNVGRSQIAEMLCKTKMPSTWKIKSAGTKVFNKEGVSVEGEKLKDRKGAEFVLAVLNEIGIDAREAERNQVTKKLVEEADVIVLMAEPETVPPYLVDNPKVRIWNIKDPKEQNLEEIRLIREQINGLVTDLITELDPAF